MYFYKVVVNTGVDCYLRKHTSAHEKMTEHQSCYKMNIFVSSLNRMHSIIQTVAAKDIPYYLSMKDIVRTGYEERLSWTKSH